MFGVLLILFVIGALCWHLVFNEQERRKLAEPGWAFYRRSKEGKELDDAVNLAVSLIAAVTCSTLFVVVLIIAVVRLFK
jgi:hypothetical protein